MTEDLLDKGRRPEDYWVPTAVSSGSRGGSGDDLDVVPQRVKSKQINTLWCQPSGGYSSTVKITLLNGTSYTYNGSSKPPATEEEVQTKLAYCKIWCLNQNQREYEREKAREMLKSLAYNTKDEENNG